MKTEEAAPVRAGTGNQFLFYLSALVVGVFLVRVLGESWSTGFKPTFPDSFSYLDVAARGPFRPFDERPIVYPTFLWLMGRSVHIAVVVQTCAYAAAFLALCMTAYKYLTSRVAAAAAIVLIFFVAIQPHFALWNQQILSESLGITLAVASICAWWAFCARPTPRGVVWAYLWTLLWMGVRDSHIVPTLTVILPAVVIGAFVWRGIDPKVKQRLFIGAAVTIAIAGWFYVAQDVSNRNQYPFHNNIGVRVLPDDDLTEWFIDGGMPMNDTLRGREGHYSWDDGEIFLRDPALDEYRDWADGPGARRFLLSLGLQFPHWYDRLVDELPTTFNDDLRGYDTYGITNRLPTASPELDVPLPIVPDFEAQLGGPRSNPAIVWWTLLAVAGIAVAGWAALRTRVQAAVPIFAAVGLVSAFVEIYVSYVGDALEVSRHLVGPFSRLAVMLAISVAIGVDGASRIRMAGPRPKAEREPEAVEVVEDAEEVEEADGDIEVAAPAQPAGDGGGDDD